MRVFAITPSEIAKRGVDWTGKLLGPITSSVWAADAGVVVSGQGADDYTSAAFFSIPAGTVGQQYQVTNTIQAGGETLERTFALQLVEKQTR